MITRENCQNLKAGDLVRWTIHTKHGIPVDCEPWSSWRKVTSIHGQDVNGDGKAFVCFYVEFGPTSTISHSTHEGDVSTEVKHV